MEFVQLPGDLGLRFIRGDEVNVAISLQRDVTNYSFTSYIYNSTSITAGGGVLGGVNTTGATVVQPTLSVVNASTGSLVLGLSETQTAALSPTGSYRWYLRWVAPGDITRTIVSGSVTAVSP